jgi:hypothetical protein
MILAQRHAGKGERHLAGDELARAQRGFMVEQDSATGMEPEGLAVVDRDVMGIELCDGIGAARMEGRLLILRGAADIASTTVMPKCSAFSGCRWRSASNVL